MLEIVIRPIELFVSYRVRNKVVYKDLNGNWISVSELTPNERKAFLNYEEAIINNQEVKKHPTVTYKY